MDGYVQNEEHMMRHQHGMMQLLFVLIICGLLFVLIYSHVYASVLIAEDKEPAKVSYSLPLDRKILKTVRVAVLKQVKEGIISFDSPIIVKTIETNEILKSLSWDGKRRVTPTASGLLLGSELFKIYGVYIKTIGESFTVNNIRYHGDLVIIRERDMTLLFINYIDLEDYLKGVLPKEVSPQWSFEALKAQAVAARTYAIFNELAAWTADYSLEKTVASQVYGGIHSEHQVTNKAVETTGGEILTCGQEVFPAYFHAACGGHTTRCDLVWHVQAHPSLRGVVSAYCKHSKHYEWVWDVSFNEIETALRNDDVRVGDIDSFDIQETDASGRASSFTISSSRGTLNAQSNRFRLVVGPEKLRSTKLSNLRIKNDRIIFEGFGWGHGVGLCQWGAKAMAEQGFDYERILEHFFPESDIAFLN